MEVLIIFSETLVIQFFFLWTGCLQCFLFGKQNNGTKTKICLSTFHQIQHNTFFEFGGKMWWNTDLLLIKKDLFEPNWMQPVSCWFSNLVMLRVDTTTNPILLRIAQCRCSTGLLLLITSCCNGYAVLRSPLRTEKSEKREKRGKTIRWARRSCCSCCGVSLVKEVSSL